MYPKQTFDKQKELDNFKGVLENYWGIPRTKTSLFAAWKHYATALQDVGFPTEWVKLSRKEKKYLCNSLGIGLMH